MLCDQCAAAGPNGDRRDAGDRNGPERVRVGCFPDLYAALAGDPPKHVITL